MSDPDDLFPDQWQYQEYYGENYEPGLEPVPRKKGLAWLAWPIILGLVGFVVLLHLSGDEPEETGKFRLGTAMGKIQGQFLVGEADFLAQAGQPKDRGESYQLAQTLNQGSVEERLGFIVLAREFAGPAEAIQQILELGDALRKHQHPLKEKETALLDILLRLLQDQQKGRFDLPSLTDEQKTFLQEELGWFGQLALAPAPAEMKGPAAIIPPGSPEARELVLDPARQTFLVLCGLILLVLFLGLVGMVGWLAVLFLGLNGKLKSGIKCGLPHGQVYAETFALWLILYLGLGAGAKILEDLLPLLVGFGLAQLASLFALAWPVLRGITWSQVCQDIGWTGAHQLGKEFARGIFCYALSLPLAMAGLLVTLILALVIHEAAGQEANPFSPTTSPHHPLVEVFSTDDWGIRIQIGVVAALIAPFVEETMFRGVLYRQLREASHLWGTVVSALFSALVVSFIFAVLHPQGLIAVPPLMALALGFNLAREWHGSLVPSITAHALNNGLIVGVGMLLFSQ